MGRKQRDTAEREGQLASGSAAFATAASGTQAWHPGPHHQDLWKFHLSGAVNGTDWFVIADYPSGLDGNFISFNGGGMFRYLGFHVYDGGTEPASSREFTIFAY